MTRRAWQAADTAALARLCAEGLTDGAIARRLGFTRKTVQLRRATLGLDNVWRRMGRPHDKADR